MGLWIYVDGCSKGNPGPAAFGMVVKDIEGKNIFSRRQYIGIQTNNVAEYRGMIAALEYIRDQNFPMSWIHSDSELVVKQMNGEYRVKKPHLRFLYQHAKRFHRNCITIKHIRRESNQEADDLANLAIPEPVLEGGD